MTAERDPRIEAVAKLLFTGPLSGLQSSSWDDSYWEEMRHDCLMAAEDVLRGIDEAAEWEYVVQSNRDAGDAEQYFAGEDAAREHVRIMATIGVERFIYRRRAAGEWEEIA